MFVVCSLITAVFSGWDHRDCALFYNGVNDVLGVKGLVCDDMLSRQALNQLYGWYAVMHLAAGELESNGVAQCIDNGMNLGRQASATAANSLGVAPPFAPAEC